MNVIILTFDESDHTKQFRRFIMETFRVPGDMILLTTKPEEVTTVLRKHPNGLYFLMANHDLRFRGRLTGLSVIKKARAIIPNLPCILMTQDPAIQNSLVIGDYLHQNGCEIFDPAYGETLKSTVSRVLTNHKLELPEVAKKNTAKAYFKKHPSYGEGVDRRVAIGIPLEIGSLSADMSSGRLIGPVLITENPLGEEWVKGATEINLDPEDLHRIRTRAEAERASTGALNRLWSLTV